MHFCYELNNGAHVISTAVIYVALCIWVFTITIEDHSCLLIMSHSEDYKRLLPLLVIQMPSIVTCAQILRNRNCIYVTICLRSLARDWITC